MAENRDLTCRACGAQFDTREKLDLHNNREHSMHGMRSGEGHSEKQRSSNTDEPGSSAQRLPDGGSADEES